MEQTSIPSQAIAALDPDTARSIIGILTDIDDTLTINNKLIPDAYNALWKLHDHNIPVIAVTGRPAGWCDAIARQWPVHGVIGENGALAYYVDNGRLKRIYHQHAADENQRKKLLSLANQVIERFPNSRIASDQAYRMFDVAIDFAEEEPVLPMKQVYKIRDFFIEQGANVKVSSIHVNAWFGDYDKLHMTQRFLREKLNCHPETIQNQWLFTGDSPNDEPMFQFFAETCGMANILNFSNELTFWPKYVTAQSGGYGFAEFCEQLFAKRAST